MRSLIFLCALLLAATEQISTEPSMVRITQTEGRFELERNGKPYLIRGAGGDQRALESLAKAGGNSIRLWGDEHLGEALDEAQKLGLTVTAGIWLGQVRQGFDWGNPTSLTQQREHLRAVVSRYKNHPALLCWALGNEMEDPQGKNVAVWTQINLLAAMVKELDPAHPTMTVVAEIGGEKVKNFHALCPEVDILGINAYGGAPSVAERYRKLGGRKPYILTEYGPPGIWELQANSIGAFTERTSTEKADSYRLAYRANVLESRGACLGSYAFLWGQKQEVTSTWFSMLLADGTRLGAAEAVAELWTDRPPANRVPTIQSLVLDRPALGHPGQSLTATLEASDPEADPLQVTWLLQRDPGDYGSGGDQEATPPTFPQAILKSDQHSASIALPKDGGLYRLFAVVRDDHGGGAVANVPIRVEAPNNRVKRTTQLPLTIYAEAGNAPTFIPSGWMGNAKAIKIDPAWPDRPHSGKTSFRCDFQAAEGWGGLAWQSPAGDWGDLGVGYDLTGAKRLSFWARGQSGGESLTFEFGIISNPKPFFDSAKGKLPTVILSSEWQRFEIEVRGADLRRIKTGFVWTHQSQGHPITFFLDDILWE